MKKISTISPYIFEGYLIIALDIDWIIVFGKLPKFDVLINNGKLCIISQQVIRK